MKIKEKLENFVNIPQDQIYPEKYNSIICSNSMLEFMNYCKEMDIELVGVSSYIVTKPHPMFSTTKDKFRLLIFKDVYYNEYHNGLEYTSMHIDAYTYVALMKKVCGLSEKESEKYFDVFEEE